MSRLRWSMWAAIIVVGGFANVTSAQQQPSLVGTWRLVSFVTTDADGTTRQYWDERASELKMLTSAEGPVVGAPVLVRERVGD